MAASRSRGFSDKSHYCRAKSSESRSREPSETFDDPPSSAHLGSRSARGTYLYLALYYQLIVSTAENDLHQWRPLQQPFDDTGIGNGRVG